MHSIRRHNRRQRGWTRDTWPNDLPTISQHQHLRVRPGDPTGVASTAVPVAAGAAHQDGHRGTDRGQPPYGPPLPREGHLRRDPNAGAVGLYASAVATHEVSKPVSGGRFAWIRDSSLNLDSKKRDCEMADQLDTPPGQEGVAVAVERSTSSARAAEGVRDGSQPPRPAA